MVPAPHHAPRGKLVGKAFAPDVVLLLESSDGATLGFYQRTAEKQKRERWRCEEPLGDLDLKLVASKHVADWKSGEAIEIPLEDWSATGASFNQKTPGKGTVTLTKKDAAHFRVEGSIEIASTDGSWDLKGPFEGDYCPMKGVARENPEPLAGVPWSLDAFAPDKLPKSPIAAIIDGNPAHIAHATYRRRKYLDKDVSELAFFEDAPPDPCAERPRGGWLTSYGADGHITSRDGAKFRDDSFAILFTDEPKAGAVVSGFNNGSKTDAKQIADVNLEIFEKDGYRSGSYDQYFSTTIAIDAIDEKSVQGRIYAAVPDSGKSMIVGAFSAVRCPALP